MAGESPKTNLQAGKTGWLLSAPDTQDNWKKDVIEIISTCVLYIMGEAQVIVGVGYNTNIQKLKWLLFLLSSSQCMHIFI